MLQRLMAVLAGVCLLSVPAMAEVSFDAGDAETDALVKACFEQDGVDFLPDTDVICYNAAIFPEEFLKLNELGPASRIIITSPGGNVATARGMSGILDRRAEPVVIAGPCMSACAMVILPGLDAVRIHHTAHIAVHGIVMMPFKRWYGWLKDDEAPSTIATLQAQMGYNFGFMTHSSGTMHMRAHMADQGVDIGYIDDISDQMEEDARAFTTCRVDPNEYWGMVSAEHLKKYMGSRITQMESFASSWDDPLNKPYQHIGTPIGERTYIFQGAYDAECEDGSVSNG